MKRDLIMLCTKRSVTPARKCRLHLEALEARDCPATYSIVDLLPPAGATSSTALGLNDNGLVVGKAASTNSRPVVWQYIGAATATGTYLTLPGADNIGTAADVNNSNMIAGETGDTVASTLRAVVWTALNAPHDLGKLPGSGESYATSLSEPDLNNVTWVVGTSATETSERATVWRVSTTGAVLQMIDLEPTLLTSRARDVRYVDPSAAPGDEYVLVSGDIKSGSVQPAVVWKLDLTGNVLNRTDLGTLGGTASWGYGINSLGNVAGESKPATGSHRAFHYSSGTMTNLGTLTNGGSQAYALNDSNDVVGRCFVLSKSGVLQGSKAFVWQNNKMLELRSQLSSGSRANWSNLHSAFDINDAGQIVGSGAVGKGSSAQAHGFLMIPAAMQASSSGNMKLNSTLSITQAKTLQTEAISRWRAAGADTSLLQGVTIRIADLPGTTLGYASGNTITLDSNAAGWGWFVDKTPRSDAEFRLRGNQGEQGRMDLLSVIMHEMGHVLGYDHHADSVMQETLAPGVRLLPEGMKLVNTARDTADVVFALLHQRKAW